MAKLNKEFIEVLESAIADYSLEYGTYSAEGSTFFVELPSGYVAEFSFKINYDITDFEEEFTEDSESAKLLEVDRCD